MTERPIYHLNLAVSGCRARIRVNGLTLIDIDNPSPIPFNEAPPINPFLVGQGNVLSIEAVASQRGPSSPLGASVAGSVAAFAQGDIVEPGECGTPVLRVDLQTALDDAGVRREDRQFPLRVDLRFDTQSPSFRALLLESESIRDEAALVDYAIRLRDLLRASDVDAVVREFTPKLTDYAVAYYEDPTTMPGEFAEFLRSVLLPGPLSLDFERDDIVIEPHCDGRIYKVMTRRDEALVATKPRPDGGRNEVPVYVARVDGALKVVR